MELSEFLLARIGEDKAVAEAAMRFRSNGLVRRDPRVQDGQWDVFQDEQCHHTTGLGVWVTDAKDQGGRYAVAAEIDRREDAAHIARWDPTRVLADCEAKKQIVVAATGSVKVDPGPEWDGSYGSGLVQGRFDGLDEALCLLALPYTDHPDYDPEWKV